MKQEAQIDDPEAGREAAAAPLDRQRPRPNSVPSATRFDVLCHVYREFCELRQGDDPPDPDLFCAHFPAIKHSLIRLIHAHFFLEEKTRLGLEPPWPEPGRTG